MPFKPVETKKVYMRVVEQIREMIETGELTPRRPTADDP